MIFAKTIMKQIKDVKGVLYGWCGANRFGFPLYYIKKRMNVNPASQFEASVKLKILDTEFRGDGFGRSIKLAETSAAIDLCAELQKAGYSIYADQSLRHEMRLNTANGGSSVILSDRTGKKRKFSDYSRSPHSGQKKHFRSNDIPLIELDAEKPTYDDDWDSIPHCSTHHAARFIKSDLKTLESSIWSHYANTKQNEHGLSLKMRLLDQFNASLALYFRPGSAFYVFGSTITGLGSYNSDLDLCFVTALNYTLPSPDFDRKFSLEALKRLRSLLYRFFRSSANMGISCTSINLIAARVPILKLTDVKFGSLDIEIDINVNNKPGLRNSHLLHYYNAVDKRFGALVLAVKHWAIKADIACPASGTLSGLSLTLMVLHFLQRPIRNCRPILPDLQELLPHCFNADIPVEQLRVFDPHLLPANSIKSHAGSGDNASVNSLPVSVLLLDFFDYFANYVDYENYAISIHFGGSLKPRAMLKNDNNNYIFVEEPYDGTNCARCVYDQRNYFKIKDALIGAYENLNNFLDLRAIGVEF